MPNLAAGPFKNQRGSILILSLWIFTLLGLLALSLAFRGRMEVKISTIREAKGIAPYSLLSAVNVARMRLEGDEEQEADSRYDEWYGEGHKEAKETKDKQKEAKEDRLARLDDPVRKLKYALSIEDEESRLNINTVPPRILEKFFELLKQQEGKKLLSSPEDLTGGILYWRGESWAKKEEKRGTYYKKEPFESLEEMFLLPGIKEEYIPLLKSYLTVFPKDKKTPFMININTVSDLVLESVIESTAGSADAQKKIYEQFIAFREGKLDQKKSQEDGGSGGAGLQSSLPKLGWQEGRAVGRALGPAGLVSPFDRSRLPGINLPGRDKEAGKDTQQKAEPQKYFVQNDLNDVSLLYLLQLPRSPDLISIMVQLVPYLTVDSQHFRVRATLSGEALKDFGAEVILGPDQEILAWQRI